MSLAPSFRARFLAPSAAWGPAAEEHGASAGAGAPDLLARMGSPRVGPGGFCKPLVLPQLDLATVGSARDEPPLSESILKRNKLALFEKQCSKVSEGLYVSGEYVAKSREALREHGITHIVNCVGAMYPEYFRGDGIAYRTLWLQDSPSEDILCVLYDTFEFIDRARCGTDTSCSGGDGSCGPDQQQPGLAVQAPSWQQQQQQDLLKQQQQQQGEESAMDISPEPSGAICTAPDTGSGGGRVLVHCSQGVSRSTTIAIAYLMWKLGQSYEEVYQAVRALRGVTSPNIGFTCQLLQWQKRRRRPPSRIRLYRIAPHTPESPLYLVPRAVGASPGSSNPDWRALDPRGCFLAHLPSKLYVWRGAQCLTTLFDAGMRCAGHLVKYEGAAHPEVVHQGEEPADLVEALTPDPVGGSSSQSQPSCSQPGSSQPGGGGTGSAAFGLPAAAAAAEPESPAGGSGGAWVYNGSSSQNAAAAARRGVEGGRLTQQQQQQQQEGSPGGHGVLWRRQGGSCDADTLVERLSQQQLGQWEMPVEEVDEYTAEFEAFYRALCKSGGSDAAGAGRLTPRSSMLLLSRDDSSALLGGGGLRPDSPATIEGRNRKYRRSSESERWGGPPAGASRLSGAAGGGGSGGVAAAGAGGGSGGGAAAAGGGWWGTSGGGGSGADGERGPVGWGGR